MRSHRRNYPGLLVPFLRPSLIRSLELVGSFKVSYNTFYLLRERVVVRRFWYGGRVKLSGV